MFVFVLNIFFSKRKDSTKQPPGRMITTIVHENFYLKQQRNELLMLKLQWENTRCCTTQQQTANTTTRIITHSPCRVASSESSRRFYTILFSCNVSSTRLALVTTHHGTPRNSGIAPFVFKTIFSYLIVIVLLFICMFPTTLLL